MKALATFLVVLTCVTAFAIGPEYSSLRDWVEQRSTNDRTPDADRVFVNFLQKDFAIVRYRKNLTVQEAISETQFRGRPLRISVFRASHRPAGEPVYDELSLKKPDRSFPIQPRDVLWLEEPTTKRN